MQSEGHLLFVYNNQAAVSTICILKQPCVLEIKKSYFSAVGGKICMLLCLSSCFISNLTNKNMTTSRRDGIIVPQHLARHDKMGIFNEGNYH